LALKMLATVESAVGDLDLVAEVVNLKGYVLSDPDFGAMNAVINGASDLFYEVFGEQAGVHTRSTVGVTAFGQEPDGRDRRRDAAPRQVRE
jgi:hypothetical protein